MIIISQKLQLSLKSSVSLLWFNTGALTVYPSGLWLSGSSCVWKKKKITLIHRRTLFTFKSLSLFIFLFFAMHFHQKPTPLQLATISQHSMTWWDTRRTDGIHTLGLSILDIIISLHVLPGSEETLPHSILQSLILHNHFSLFFHLKVLLTRGFMAAERSFRNSPWSCSHLSWNRL